VRKACPHLSRCHAFPLTGLNLAIIDDHPATHLGLMDMLRTWPHGRVVLRAVNGVHYEQLCQDAPPIHIAIVDLNMPVRNGWDTIAWMKEHQPWVRALAHCYEASPAAILRAMHCGACGAISKTAEQAELFTALDNVRTMGYHRNALVRDLFTVDGRLKLQAEEVPKRIQDLFTPRELQVMHALAEQDMPTFATAGKRLSISVSTVDKHVQNLCAKLGVCGREGLYRFYILWELHKLRK
jgi:two-component system invasion response regulator UvrY